MRKKLTELEKLILAIDKQLKILSEYDEVVKEHCKQVNQLCSLIAGKSAHRLPCPYKAGIVHEEVKIDLRSFVSIHVN